MIKFFKLFTYASRGEKLLVAFGIFFAIVAGAISPAVSIVMGKVIAIYDPKYTQD